MKSDVSLMCNDVGFDVVSDAVVGDQKEARPSVRSAFTPSATKVSSRRPSNRESVSSQMPHLWLEHRISGFVRFFSATEKPTLTDLQHLWRRSSGLWHVRAQLEELCRRHFFFPDIAPVHSQPSAGSHVADRGFQPILERQKQARAAAFGSIVEQGRISPRWRSFS